MTRTQTQTASRAEIQDSRDRSAEGKYAPFEGIKNARSCRNIANIFRHSRAHPRTPSPQALKFFEGRSDTANGLASEHKQRSGYPLHTAITQRASTGSHVSLGEAFENRDRPLSIGTRGPWGSARWFKADFCPTCSTGPLLRTAIPEP